MRKEVIAVAFSLVSTGCLGRVDARQKHVSTATLGNVLFCLQAKAAPSGFPPPRFNKNFFRIRYVYGKYSPVDQPSELHMVVYGPHESTATLFEVYLRTAHGKRVIFFGDAATLKRKKRELVTEEIPGGQATLRRIEKLIALIDRRSAVMLPDAAVKQGAATCVYLP